MRDSATADIKLNVCVGACSTYLLHRHTQKSSIFYTHTNLYKMELLLYSVFPCLNLKCVTGVHSAYILYIYSRDYP